MYGVGAGPFGRALAVGFDDGDGFGLGFGFGELDAEGDGVGVGDLQRSWPIKQSSALAAVGASIASVTPSATDAKAMRFRRRYNLPGHPAHCGRPLVFDASSGESSHSANERTDVGL